MRNKFKEKKLQNNRTGFVNKKDWDIWFIVQKLEMGGYQVTACTEDFKLRDFYKTKKEIHDALNETYQDRVSKDKVIEFETDYSLIQSL